jgi:lipopolysaccharide/colanic/teichoic acid biosynthesis glycosyltransferase
MTAPAAELDIRIRRVEVMPETASLAALEEEMARDPLPTIWGLDPVGLHDRFWAARGVYVVRPDNRAELPDNAEVYMLTDRRTLAVFRLRPIVDKMYWVKPAVVFVRLRNARNHEYCERVVQKPDGKFAKFERDYGLTHSHTARVILTRDPSVARMWQLSDGTDAAWRIFRRQTHRVRREFVWVRGHYYNRFDRNDLEDLAGDLQQWWDKPSTTIDDVEDVKAGVWASPGTKLDPSVQFFGPAWIGAGRNIKANSTVVGPAILWDDPALRPRPAQMQWTEIEPTAWAARAVKTVRPASSLHRFSKRTFDIVFSFFAILFSLPLYPIIMLAIWLEDGSPFIFAHKRETRGGKEFGCLKFRSMRKDADVMKEKLANENQSDGPQFFIVNDPRVTRVGRILRKCNLDEIPQFINVLMGDMSVVGPRPSPRKENQCCPPWREARLSVRPGITGLWQVNRTRRQGLDFQEWVKFDIEYVQKASWRLDLFIICKTIMRIVGS